MLVYLSLSSNKLISSTWYPMLGLSVISFFFFQFY